jgi:hypothetical protein
MQGALNYGASVTCHIFPRECNGNARLKEANFISAIIAVTVECDGMEGLPPNHLCHRIGQLNFAARTFALMLQNAHYLWLEDVAS